jgi:hypothetical protein
MKIEFFYRTTRGATAMKFFEENRAREWYRNQKEKHGDSLPKMELVKQTTIIKEEIYEPFESATCIGRAVEQVPAYATLAIGIQRMC